jgi:hypothetical protein
MIDHILLNLTLASENLQRAYDEAKRDGRDELAAAITAAQVKINGCFVQIAKPKQVVV